MANSVTGRIYGISPTQSIQTNGGNTFMKREIILDATRFDPYTGERDQYENFPMFEFTGDRCKDLDGFEVGQVVTITFDLQGGFFEHEGKKKNFTKIRGYKIELKHMSTNAPQPQPMQQATQPQAAPPLTSKDLPW